MVLTTFTSCISTKSLFKHEVENRFKELQDTARLITKSDLDKLPEPIANFLEHCGWLGKEIPLNFHAKFSGEFSMKEGKYQKIHAEQYNWLDEPTRIFHIQNWMMGGRHHFDKNGAFMLIKLFKRIKLVNAKGPEMNQSELVTYLNDLFILAPGALVYIPIQWEILNEQKVKATISYFGNTVSAEVSFNKNHEMVNFISIDRYASSDGKKTELLPWSTPIRNYVELNGIKVPTYGEAIWHFPDHDFNYIKFNIKEVSWNTKK